MDNHGRAGQISRLRSYVAPLRRSYTPVPQVGKSALSETERLKGLYESYCEAERDITKSPLASEIDGIKRATEIAELEFATQLDNLDKTIECWECNIRRV